MPFAYKALSALVLAVALGAGVLVFWQNSQIDYSKPGVQIIESSDFALDDIDGSVVYLDFWASWCLPCRDSFPWMQQMVTQYHDQGLRVVAVNLDHSQEDMQAFIDEYGALFPIVQDPTFQLFRQHSLVGIPSAIIFQRQGDQLKQVKVHQGFVPERAAKLEQELVALLGDRI